MVVSCGWPWCSGVRQPRGFAIITAITLLAMVMLCMVVLAAAFEHEVARTRQTHRRLQLELLASAGALAVEQRVDALATMSRHHPSANLPQPGVYSWQLALPAAVRHRGGMVRLRIVAGESGKSVARVSATYAGLHARQTITFADKSGHWRIQSIALGGHRHWLAGPIIGRISGPATTVVSGAGCEKCPLSGVIHVHCVLKPVRGMKGLHGVLVFKSLRGHQCVTGIVLRHVPSTGVNRWFTWSIPAAADLSGRYRVFLELERHGECVGRTRSFTTRIFGIRS